MPSGAVGNWSPELLKEPQLTLPWAKKRSWIFFLWGEKERVMWHCHFYYLHFKDSSRDVEGLGLPAFGMHGVKRKAVAGFSLLIFESFYDLLCLNFYQCRQRSTNCVSSWAAVLAASGPGSHADSVSGGDCSKRSERFGKPASSWLASSSSSAAR